MLKNSSKCRGGNVSRLVSGLKHKMLSKDIDWHVAAH